MSTHPLLDLQNIRAVLVRLEETIIFALVERAQFKINAPVYQPGGIPIPHFSGSFLDYLLHGTERLHATVRRYTSPDEHPFFDDLPPSLLPPLDYHAPIVPTQININKRIKTAYEQEIIPLFCPPGDDQQYGSTAVCDVACLQALSKRIHYGKFVAESKYRHDPQRFRSLIAQADHEALRSAITDPLVEARLLERVRRKAATYAQELDDAQPKVVYKLDPDLFVRLYREWIIPMTKDVEIAYLLARPLA
ncbi:MAG: chorismate mutase [bacterium]|nr:chorismate mutase [bacterium]